jgi:hypothetical protein
MDELSEEARALLREARGAYAPEPGAAERVLARVLVAAHAPPRGGEGGSQGPTPTTGAGAWGAPLKLAVASAVIVAAALSAYVGVHPREVPEPEPVVTAPAPSEPRAEPPLARPEPPLEPEVSPEPPDETEAPLARPEPALAAPAPVAPRRTRRAAPADPAAELRLLRQAQSALSSGRGGEALALLRDHQRAFPRTQFRQERDAIRILALCATGRESAARRLGRRFLERAGRSPMAGAVRESCAFP